MSNELFKFYLGKTQGDEDYYLDLRKKLLVVDKYKKGQSALFYNIINDLIENYTNDEVQIALIDYKDKYYTKYKKNDKLFLSIANNNDEVIEVLDLIKSIQNARMCLMKECNVKNIEEYNKKEVNKIPHMFIFVDEISDLIENGHIDKLLSLINPSKCTGINIFVGTSLLDKGKALCSKVKASFMDRICFPVDTKEESKLVIDEYGAEKLNKGEMIINDTVITLN